MRDLHFRSASELAAAIRAREISSRELLEHFLGRVEKLNPQLIAIVTLDAEGARARADAADAARERGESWGPLHGVPITIKDTFETAGVRTTAGAPMFAQHVPAADAPAVARLRAGGAVIFGKTNTPVLAGDCQSYNPIFGTTNNPWDVARTPGGSSGGAAAALASGLSALELGSDIGGSIRTPCHWTGVFGLKPSHGIVPIRGHIPGPPGTLGEPDLGVAGPMARSADDLDLALDLIAGPNDDEAVGWRLELPRARRAQLADYRVAAWLDDPGFPIDAAVRASLDAALEALRRAGARIDERARPFGSLRELVDVYQRLLWGVLIAGYPERVYEQLAQRAAANPNDDSALGRTARFGTARFRDIAAADEARNRMRARLRAFFAEYDVLLLPVNPVAAIAHDHSEPMPARSIQVNGSAREYLDLLAWISPATLCLHPAAAAPVAPTHAGLPVGIQIVAPYLEDRSAIDFARWVERTCGGFRAPPGC